MIGSRRWDREHPERALAGVGPDTRSPSRRPLWTRAANAHVIDDTGETKTVTFVDPQTPAYFEATFDSRDAAPARRCT